MSCVGWNLSVQHLLLPKPGLLESECEDAVGVRRDRHRFCVADGATESYDSRRWARLLTKHWASSTRLLTSDELAPWMRRLGARLERRWAKRTLPWYAEEKARMGAFAALVGVAFSGSGDEGPSWQSIALGDSCLVHRRGASIVQALPISDPDAFGYHPTLIPSKPEKQNGIAENFTIAGGHAQPGDVFLLLTDAIAAWYLRTCAEEQALAAELERLLEASDTAGIGEMLSWERAKGKLRSDDIAIVRILIRPDPVPPMECEM